MRALPHRHSHSGGAGVGRGWGLGAGVGAAALQPFTLPSRSSPRCSRPLPLWPSLSVDGLWLWVCEWAGIAFSYSGLTRVPV